jgi:hypothetical protein
MNEFLQPKQVSSKHPNDAIESEKKLSLNAQV